MKRIKVPKYCATLAEYARIERVSRATATRRDQAGQIVRNDGGQIDLAATRQIVRELAGTTTDPEIVKARLKILQAEGRLRELRLREKQGALIDRMETERAIQNAFALLLRDIRSLTPRLYFSVRSASDPPAGMHAVHEELRTTAYNIFGHVHDQLAEIAGTRPSIASKVVREAWAASAPADWREAWESRTEADRIVDPTPNERTVKNEKQKTK